MLIGYARVSGLSQDLQIQIDKLKAKGCQQIYQEKMTGTKKERPEFQKVLEALKPGDTLMVTKLDRFARSAEDGIHLVKELLAHGVNVHVLNMGLVENTMNGRLLLSIMSAFAEFERDLIVERLQEGKEQARQNPEFREGRKPTPRAKLAHAMTLLETHSYTQVVEMTGISKSVLIREKRKQKAAIATGGN
jgi:DNA invertase Pin-like site-specific DNA recombinase